MICEGRRGTARDGKRKEAEWDVPGVRRLAGDERGTWVPRGKAAKSRQRRIQTMSAGIQTSYGRWLNRGQAGGQPWKARVWVLRIEAKQKRLPRAPTRSQKPAVKMRSGADPRYRHKHRHRHRQYRQSDKVYEADSAQHIPDVGYLYLARCKFPGRQ